MNDDVALVGDSSCVHERASVCVCVSVGVWVCVCGMAEIGDVKWRRAGGEKGVGN